MLQSKPPWPVPHAMCRTHLLADHSMDWHSFKLLLPLLHLDMVRVLDGQPAGIMVKDLATGQHLMHLEVWHQMMLKYYLVEP